MIEAYNHLSQAYDDTFLCTHATLVFTHGFALAQKIGLTERIIPVEEEMRIAQILQKKLGRPKPTFHSFDNTSGGGISKLLESSNAAWISIIWGQSENYVISNVVALGHVMGFLKVSDGPYDYYALLDTAARDVGETNNGIIVENISDILERIRQHQKSKPGTIEIISFK